LTSSAISVRCWQVGRSSQHLGVAASDCELIVQLVLSGPRREQHAIKPGVLESDERGNGGRREHLEQLDVFLGEHSVRTAAADGQRPYEPRFV